MLNRRWWDIAVTGAAAVIVVALLAGLGPDEAGTRVGGIVAIVVFAVLYAAIARPVIGRDPGWRYPVFVAALGVLLIVATSVAPFLAMLQTLAYPLVWVLAPRRRPAVIASGVVALAVWIGFFVGGGFGWSAFVSGATTAIFSFVFATALGLWIYSIAEYGEERARLLAELTAAQREVEALSRDRGAAAERERLARDIHDTLAQTLAGLVLLAERAGRQSREGQTDAAADTVATLEQIAREALDEARALVSRTAAVPSDAAFEAALERLVARFRAEAGLAIDLDLHAAPGAASLAREAQVVLLRCLQEALANVRKHAGATLVRVSVRMDAAGTVDLVVADDGRGFEVGTAPRGFGLEGMAERVGLAGGHFAVVSAAGAGTTVTVRVPDAVVPA
jgi:signal transduction histidine kinase